MNAPAPILWQPSPEQIEARRLTAFAEMVRDDWGHEFGRDYFALWQWSVDRPDQFWTTAWRYLDIVYEGSLVPALEDGDRFPGARWFPNARLNYAETILNAPDDRIALTAASESGDSRDVTYGAIKREASRVQQALADLGVGPDSRVGAIFTNIPEAITAMLGTTSLGGVFSSVSPDFGVSGILDRLSQVSPDVLFAVDGYTFAGKRHDVREKIAEVVAALPSVKRVIVLPTDAEPSDLSDIRDAVAWDDFLAPHDPREIRYTRLPFDHPLFILYTSGTTGVPKCIVHTTGGSMLKSIGEHALQFDVGSGDTAFFPTTLGWMMWNFLINYLPTGAKIVCYDGSPFYPSTDRLWQLAAEQGVTVLGLGSSYIEACRKADTHPGTDFDLSRVRTVLAGGSVLTPECFDFVYERVAADVHLTSGSGGTEIMGCLLGANPWGPVHRGELQAPALGMDMAVFGPEGESTLNAKGELVCRTPFPSLPIGLLGDEDGSRFRDTYFSQNPGAWTQGDFAETSSQTGGYVVHGRSDATLNPGGVRIGTAEIYRQVDKIGAVSESIVVGQKWQNDVRIVLFVKLREGMMLDDALSDEIRQTIRAGASPRHVPRRIVAVEDIPKTRTGKIAELAVRDVVNGETVNNREALANPDALDGFADRLELAE